MVDLTPEETGEKLCALTQRLKQGQSRISVFGSMCIVQLGYMSSSGQLCCISRCGNTWRDVVHRVERAVHERIADQVLNRKYESETHGTT